MHGSGKSDRSIVPRKSANKAGVRQPAAELMEERERAKGNPISKPAAGHSAGGGCNMNWSGYGGRRKPLGRQDPRQEPSAVIPPAGICAGAAG